MTNATSNMREYKRLWAAKRRSDFMQGKSCAVCGATESLEVDHIDPSQKVSHRIWTWAIARRDAELAKCQILCTEHHKQKTRADRQLPEHGTISRYGSIHKCRCDLCRKANAERGALNKAKKRERELNEFRTEYKRAA